MRRIFDTVLIFFFVLMLLGTGTAQTVTDEEYGITVDLLADWEILPEEHEEDPGRLAGIRIGIDPGHQKQKNNEKEAIAPNSKKTRAKVASGTKGTKTKIPEYVTVLEISFALRDALLREGAEVCLTRETHEVNISNQERAKMMNVLGVDLVLRIHCNGSTNPSANGIGLYVNKSYPISAESRRAAECILPRMT